jgi:DNA primase
MVLYTRESLEKLRRKVDLIEVISEHIELFPQGKHFIGECPFDSDYEKNLEVDPKKNEYYCHKCLAHGDALQFLMTNNQMSFQTAVEMLSDKYDVELEKIPYRH